MLTPKEIAAAIPHAVIGVEVPGLGPRRQGKVRDLYCLPPWRALIATDRISAFDRVLGTIPHRGQVLTELSKWWFDQTRDLVANHLAPAGSDDPNVTIAREADALPVEVVVRGYITGVTSTALWTLYAAGVDRPYGLDLPPDLQKHDPLPSPVITPTTKAPEGAHDERLTSAEVIERNLVEPALWAEVQAIALALFERGQSVARRAGLVLVDTKYEFGLIDGQIALIDEIHTPDSSRYWLAAEYESARAAGRDPESYDKEVLRRWLKARGYAGDGEPPPLPESLVVEVSQRYIDVFERLTGQRFVPGEQPAPVRIAAGLAAWSAQLESL